MYRDTAYQRLLATLEAHGSKTIVRGHQAMATCPSHPDDTPSLHVTDATDKVLAYCHGGCPIESVVAALGLTTTDLKDEQFTYRYDNGREVVRKPGKKFHQRNTERPRELYGLARVRKAVANGETVYVPEGESDCHTAWAMGVAATTNPEGSGKWSLIDPSPLYGAKVVVIADNDEPGRRHAHEVVASLREHADVTLARAAVGKDLSDHVRAGKRLDELIVEPLPDADPAAFPGSPRESRETRETAPWWCSAVRGDVLDATEFPPLTYLVEDLLVRGGHNVLAGPPKIGKSYVAASIALAVAQGGKALGALRAERADVLYLSPDDASQRRMKHRLRELNEGAPIPSGLTLHFESIGRGTVAQDNLLDYLSTFPSCGLVIVDTLEHLRPMAPPGGMSAYSLDVAFLGTLRLVCAQRPDVTLLTTAHTRKGEDDDAIAAISGTHGITAGVDAALRLTGRRLAPRRLVDIVSRDAEDSRLILRWSPAGLVVQDGDPDDPTLLMTDDDAKVYQAVVDVGDPITAAELLPILDGMPKIGNRLASLTKAGHLRRVGRGRYEA